MTVSIISGTSMNYSLSDFAPTAAAAAAGASYLCSCILALFVDLSCEVERG